MRTRDKRVPWTHTDDMELVEAVLRHLRNGSTVIDGCREFAENSNGVRSIDSSKYRFHTVLKDKHMAAYEIAKAQGQQYHKPSHKRVPNAVKVKEIKEQVVDNTTDVDPPVEITIDDIALLVRTYKKQQESKPVVTDQTEELEKLREENKRLREMNEHLKNDNLKLNKAAKQMETDYKALKQAIQVLKNAGLNFNVPSPESTVKYVVNNKTGLVECVE